MISNKLSEITKQYSCSIISLFVVLYETRYNQQKYISGITELPL